MRWCCTGGVTKNGQGRHTATNCGKVNENAEEEREIDDIVCGAGIRRWCNDVELLMLLNYASTAVLVAAAAAAAPLLLLPLLLLPLLRLLRLSLPLLPLLLLLLPLLLLLLPLLLLPLPLLLPMLLLLRTHCACCCPQLLLLQWYLLQFMRCKSDQAINFEKHYDRFDIIQDWWNINWTILIF